MTDAHEDARAETTRYGGPSDGTGHSRATTSSGAAAPSSDPSRVGTGAGASSPITVAVTRTVSPDRAREAAAWARSGQDLISTYPGYLGSGWIRPDPASTDWHMLFRFADAASLDVWEKSAERAWWMSTGQGLVEHGDQERRTGIEGWFDEPSSVEVISAQPRTPPRWKQMISIFIVFYPLSVLANYLAAPLLGECPIWARVLVTVFVLTPVMTYFALPFVTRALRPWLLRGR